MNTQHIATSILNRFRNLENAIDQTRQAHQTSSSQAYVSMDESNREACRELLLGCDNLTDSVVGLTSEVTSLLETYIDMPMDLKKSQSVQEAFDRLSKFLASVPATILDKIFTGVNVQPGLSTPPAMTILHQMLTKCNEFAQSGAVSNLINNIKALCTVDAPDAVAA